MAEANNAMCNYLSVPEIFADYWNGAVFGGVQKIQAEDLESYSGTYYAIPDGKSCNPSFTFVCTKNNSNVLEPL